MYRHKREPCESATVLARRVDKVWRAQNREQFTPSRQAPVLPLRCWTAMHEAVGRPGYLHHAHDLNEERLARDKLVISLGVPGGLRAGELGLLSASRSRIDHHSRLVLLLVAGAVTKSGRSEIVVPMKEPPFDALPLAEDFERLRALRVARSGDDHLFTGAWHYGMSGGLTTRQVQYLLCKMADKAHIAEGVVLAGHSMRRSMVHISAAAGWPLERIAAVLGHGSTRETREMLPGGIRRQLDHKPRGPSDCCWRDPTAGADWPINATAHVEPDPDGPALPPRWWACRDLDADRATAAALARSTREGVTGRRVAHRSLRAAVAVLLRRSARRRGPPVPASAVSLRGQPDQRQHNEPSQRHPIPQRPPRGYGINPHVDDFSQISSNGFLPPRRSPRRPPPPTGAGAAPHPDAGPSSPSPTT